MRPFDYLRPATAAEAVAAWTPEAAYLGGGTNLVDLMKLGVALPAALIDVNRIGGADAVELTADGGARIGAAVRNGDLARHEGFARAFPMVAEALLAGASGQLRNAATVGGNLLQRTRCAYFQDPRSPCNRRDPGTGCAAREGENRNLAVLGWSEQCIATNPSDFCVPLAALAAEVEVEGRGGSRRIPLHDFHRLPGDAPEREFALEPGELVTALILPAGTAGFAPHGRYLKVRERTSYAFALVSAAAALRMEGGTILEARLALGAVAAKPWRVEAAEALMKGQAPDEVLFARAASAALEGATPSGDNAYKIELARRTAVRALGMAARGTPARMPALPASPFGANAHA